MSKANIHTIFTPNSQPTITYVEREEARLEQHLRDALEKPNAVISLSGPSKSGKSVLIRKVVDPNLLIQVPGASIRNEGDLWGRVLSWMEVPSSTTTVTSTETTIKGSLTASAEGSFPLVAKGSGSLGGALERSGSTSITSVSAEDGFARVVREIGGSDFVIFLDDFHYIPRDRQTDIAKNIKAIAEAGVKVCTASVPHRADDVVRANPELRGRLSAIDFTYWADPDLKKIAELGFTAMGLQIPTSVIDRLANEAIGSPQLMQSLCLNLCLEKQIREAFGSPTHLEYTDRQITDTLERTSTQSDFSSLLEALHSGPRKRGTERKEFELIDGSRGDVYRTILIALKRDPLKLSLNYETLMERIRIVCSGESPAGSSVTQALKQMEDISRTISAMAPVLEWDEDVLDIIEPYFLFYLRCSPRLTSIGIKSS